MSANAEVIQALGEERNHNMKESFAELKQQFQANDAEHKEIRKETIEVNTKITEVNTTVTKMHTAMLGINGKGGFVADLVAFKTQIEANENSIKSQEKKWNYVIGGGKFAAIISSITGIVFGAIKVFR